MIFKKILFLSLAGVAHLFYLFIFRERGREEETEGEKHQRARETLIGCLLPIPPTRDLAHNPGMCPDQELNW